MKMKKWVTTVLASAFLFTGAASASEVDVLVNKLVEKNILTQSDAKVILDEMKKEEEKDKKVTAEAAKDSFELPKWIKNTALKGDVRVRYQSQDMDNDSRDSRDRARIRARLGIVSKPNDKWEAGIGLATGGTDPRSTNETLDNTFETPDIRLDYAYAKYSPNKIISIMAGKIENPIWGTKDLLWDSDIYPDGIAAAFSYKINDNFEIFATPAYFILDEYSSSKDDPAMVVFQPGLKWKAGKAVDVKFAATYYNFLDMKGNDFSEHGSGSNSTISSESSDLLYEYDSIALDAEIGFKLADKIKHIETLSLFGQYVDSDADTENKGILYGFKFGDKSVKEAKDWQVKVNYRKLEKDAWADFLPDSDFYSGATDVKGMEYELTLGLAKNITLGLDYYHAKPILTNSDLKEKLFQADLVVKF